MLEGRLPERAESRVDHAPSVSSAGTGGGATPRVSFAGMVAKGQPALGTPRASIGASWQGLSLNSPGLANLRKSLPGHSPSHMSIIVDAASASKQKKAAEEEENTDDADLRGETPDALVKRMRASINSAGAQAEDVLEKLRRSLPHPPIPRAEMELSQMMVQLAADDVAALSKSLHDGMHRAFEAADALRLQADKLGPLKARLSTLEDSLGELKSIRAELEKRLESDDSQLDLLRNAVSRRDWLLAEQRSAYYKELLRYKGFENAQMPPPAPDWEESVKRKGGIQQNPVFFDACVYEATHLCLDEPLGGEHGKAATALKLASAREGTINAQAAEKVDAAMRAVALAEKKVRYVTVTCRLHGGHMTVTCSSSPAEKKVRYMTVTWRSHDGYTRLVTRREEGALHDGYMAVT